MVEKKDSFNTLEDSESLSSSSVSHMNVEVDEDASAGLVVNSSITTAIPVTEMDPLLAVQQDTQRQSRGSSVDDENVVPPPSYDRVVGGAVATRNDSGDDAGASGPVQSSLTPQEQHDRIKCGAGVATGIFGLFMGGPVLALLLGFGTAYAADQPGPAGDVARAIGEVALIAKAKFRKLDDQHHFVDQGRDMATRTMTKLQEADRKHRFVDRIKEWSIRAFHNTVTFVKEHRLIERGTLAVGRAAYWVANKIADKIHDAQQRQRRGPSPPPPQGTGEGARGGSMTRHEYSAVSGIDKY